MLIKLLTLACIVSACSAEFKNVTGCWRESTSVRSWYRSTTNKTPKECTDYCRNWGTKYSGMSKTSCYCINSYQFWGEESIDKCDYNCPRNTDIEYKCGANKPPTGFVFMTVYENDHPCHSGTDDCNYKSDGVLCVPKVTGRLETIPYTCECNNAQIWGTNCEFRNCTSNPCHNGGTCADREANGFKCTCSDGGYGGIQCAEIDDCANNPCANGGTCVDQHGGYGCVCKAGYKGKTCSEAKPEICGKMTCRNGGTCTVVNNIFPQCACAEGFSGPYCEVISESVGDLCFNFECNGNACIDKESRYMSNYCVRGSGSCAVMQLSGTGVTGNMWRAGCADTCEEGAARTADGMTMTNVKCCTVDRCNYVRDVNIGRLSGAPALAASSALLTLVAALVSRLAQ